MATGGAEESAAAPGRNTSPPMDLPCRRSRRPTTPTVGRAPRRSTSVPSATTGAWTWPIGPTAGRLALVPAAAIDPAESMRAE